MRRTASLFTVAVAGLLLFGCNSGTKNDTTGNSPQAGNGRLLSMPHHSQW